jgi:hypothetical protein
MPEERSDHLSRMNAGNREVSRTGLEKPHVINNKSYSRCVHAQDGGLDTLDSGFTIQELFSSGFKEQEEKRRRATGRSPLRCNKLPKTLRSGVLSKVMNLGLSYWSEAKHPAGKVGKLYR